MLSKITQTVEYEEWIFERWGGSLTTEKARITAALGLAGEAGEVIELIKKAHRSDKPIDRNKLVLELGDVLHYVTVLALQNGFGLEDLMVANKEKLLKRDQERPDWGGAPAVSRET